MRFISIKAQDWTQNESVRLTNSPDFDSTNHSPRIFLTYKSVPPPRDTRRSMRYLSTRYRAALFTALTALILLSSRTTAVPVTHSSNPRDLSEPVVNESDAIARRTVHLTARPSWKFQLGTWSVTFLAASVFSVFQTYPGELYNEVMDLTAPSEYGNLPQGRYFQYNFGQLSLIFASTDNRYVPWEVIYAFAEQAINRAHLGFAGVYSGVSAFFRLPLGRPYSTLSPKTCLGGLGGVWSSFTPNLSLLPPG